MSDIMMDKDNFTDQDYRALLAAYAAPMADNGFTDNLIHRLALHETAIENHMQQQAQQERLRFYSFALAMLTAIGFTHIILGQSLLMALSQFTQKFGDSLNRLISAIPFEWDIGERDIGRLMSSVDGPVIIQILDKNFVMIFAVFALALWALLDSRAVP